MELELLKILSAGGDLGIFVLIYFLWKFDRRIIMVEEKIKHNTALIGHLLKHNGVNPDA